jgi:hypothetical protein
MPWMRKFVSRDPQEQPSKPTNFGCVRSSYSSGPQEMPVTRTFAIQAGKNGNEITSLNIRRRVTAG